jgi:membrane protein DedA with SNARE-associated domain
MSSLAETALTYLVAYGAPILFVTAYLGSLGIPFPITLVIIAAGAFTRQGILDWRLSIPACLAGAVLADNSEYMLGHYAGRWLERRFGSGTVWRSALGTFNRQGGWAILLTRFWLTNLAPVVNLVAGTRYPYRRFLFFDITGELLWVLLYGGLGYAFGSAWELVSQFVSDFTGLSFGLVILGAGVYFLIKRRNKAARKQE